MGSRVPPLLARFGLRVLSILPSRCDPLLPADLDRRPKVFGIGFHKTGTTSLGRAMRTLGFRVQKGFGFNRPGKRVVIPEPVTLERVRNIAFRMVPFYAAFEDNPWPLLFRDLDAAFPGSRFIMTLRDPQKWLRSAVNHFGAKSNATFDLIYGQKGFRFAGNESAALARFERHNAEVLDYFHDRMDDLLVWDLTSDPSWDTLCGFLECPRPRRPFPHGKDSAARSRPLAQAH